MGITMNDKKLKALTKITVEAALNAELDHHLGHTQYEHKGHHTGNNRNGYSTKTLKGGLPRCEDTALRCSHGKKLDEVCRMERL